MREIKCRAWDKWDKKMIYQENIVNDFVIHIDTIGYEYCEEGGGGIEWKESKYIILLQYIGLKDKKEKGIYEGDIVNQLGKGIYEVRWEKRCAGFMLGEENDWRWIKEGYQQEYEVIGNIYENPELLKVIRR